MAGKHRWVKIKIHVYICRKCGTGKVNAQRGGQWFTTFHTPDGESREQAHVPVCAIGPRTKAYLDAHISAIAVSS